MDLALLLEWHCNQKKYNYIYILTCINLCLSGEVYGTVMLRANITFLHYSTSLINSLLVSVYDCGANLRYVH